MTRLAQLLVVLTSLAPVGFVQAAVLLGRGKQAEAFWLTVAAVLAVVVCHLLLYGVRKWRSDVPKVISEPSTKEGEPLAFLVAYALPLVSAKADDASVAGLVVFAVLMALAVWQQQIFHINPLLAILGYHFFGAKTTEGAPVTIISRTKALAPGTLKVVQISEYLWLHSKDAGGTRGSTARNA
jgi:hypothetical protein